MKRKILYLSTASIFLSCLRQEEIKPSPEALYPKPQTYEFNRSGGYEINTMTGDSIIPIIKKKWRYINYRRTLID